MSRETVGSVGFVSISPVVGCAVSVGSVTDSPVVGSVGLGETGSLPKFGSVVADSVGSVIDGVVSVFCCSLSVGSVTVGSVEFAQVSVGSVAFDSLSVGSVAFVTVSVYSGSCVV